MKAGSDREGRVAKRLRGAGVRLIRLALPVPVPPANVYLVGTGKLAMVDCGPRWKDGWKRVVKRLAPGEKVSQLLVTHGHVDHHGAAAQAVRDLDCTPRSHPLDLPAVRDFEKVLRERYTRWAQVAREAGMPQGTIQRMEGHYLFLNSLGEDAPRVEPIEHGARIEVDGSSLEALHVPGHTAGSMVFLDRERRLLFSGDTVLPGITPNPFFEGLAPGPSGPETFLASIAKLRDLPVDLVLPGHGEPFADLAGRLTDYERHHRDRQQAIHTFLHQKGEGSAFSVVERLFPGVGQVDQWLALAEVVGHLQMMERAGRVERAGGKGGVVSWRPAR